MLLGHSSLHLTQMIFLALDTVAVETWIILEAGLSTGCEIFLKKERKKRHRDTESRTGGEQRPF